MAPRLATALPALAHLWCGYTYAQLAAGVFGIGIATFYRYA